MGVSTMKKRNERSAPSDVFAIVELEDQELTRVLAGLYSDVVTEANYGCAEGCTNNCPKGCSP